jgi:Pyridine nucleotide-disulphide oxidoreductase
MRAKTILDSFRIKDNFFMVGPYASRVSFQSQQIRALNLAWAISIEDRNLSEKNVAIVGASIAGMTSAAAFAAYGAKVTIFEKVEEINCKIFNAEGRFIHPNINFIPDEELSFTTQLPIMNWHADTATEVIIQLRKEFSIYKKVYSITPVPREVKRIDPMDNGQIQVFIECENRNQGWDIAGLFDYVICCTGFSSETQLKSISNKEKYLKSPLYWHGQMMPRNNQMEQLPTTVLVIGAGDGGIIDALFYGAGWRGSYIYQLALKTTISLGGKIRSVDLHSIPLVEIETKRSGLKTVVVNGKKANKKPEPAKWHQFLLETLSRSHRGGKAAIEIREEEAIYDDSKNLIRLGNIVNAESFKLDSTHVIVRIGSKHETTLITGFDVTPEKERHSSPYLLEKYWDDSFCSNCWTDDYFKKRADAALHNWARHYFEVSEKMYNANVTVTKKTEGGFLVALTEHTKTGMKFLPGLPHIFGIPFEINPPNVAMAGIGE